MLGANATPVMAGRSAAAAARPKALLDLPRLHASKLLDQPTLSKSASMPCRTFDQRGG